MQYYDSISQKLKDNYNPAHLEVINESNQHNVPENSETHFKVVLVSDKFMGIPRVKRHQMIYATLADELSGTVHALALHLFSVDEWQSQHSAPDSPKCMGGSQ